MITKEPFAGEILVERCDFCGSAGRRALTEEEFRQLEDPGFPRLYLWPTHPHDGKTICWKCCDARPRPEIHPDHPVELEGAVSLRYWDDEDDFDPARAKGTGFYIPSAPPPGGAPKWFWQVVFPKVLAGPFEESLALMIGQSSYHRVPRDIGLETELGGALIDNLRVCALFAHSPETPWPFVARLRIWEGFFTRSYVEENFGRVVAERLTRDCITPVRVERLSAEEIDAITWKPKKALARHAAGRASQT